MFVIVAGLVVVSWLYEGRSNEYENLLKAQENSINSISQHKEQIQKENDALKKENLNLNNKVKEYEEEKEKNISFEGDFSTYQQTMLDLADISNMIKQGNIKEAKKELEKIDTNGFSNESLAFYESLCRELGVEK